MSEMEKPCWKYQIGRVWGPWHKEWVGAHHLELQNSRIFCERQRQTILERKVWSKCKNGRGEWCETLRACEVRALHTWGSCLRRFPPSENVWKRMFCSLPITRSLHLPHIPVGIFTDRSIFSLNLSQIQIPRGTKWPIAITSTEQCQHVKMMLTYSHGAELFHWED